ncbi:MAG TPA: hypothetical protein VGO50_20455 [Pyrinomonadaceae bacterium]|jgi:hypothetical protein|nr:hypothetical protein [Pyrinomonadaceae bacterium]
MNIFREIVEDIFYKFIAPPEIIVILEMPGSYRRPVYLLILAAALAGFILYRYWF